MYILFLIYLFPPILAPSWKVPVRTAYVFVQIFFLAIFKWQHFVLQFPNRCYKASSSFSSHYSVGHGEFSAADGGGAGDFDYSNAKAPKTGKINSKPTFNSGCNMPLKAHQVVWGVSVDSCQISLEMFIKVQLWALARPLCYLGLCLGLLSCWKINLYPGWVPLEQVINKSVSILLHLSFHPPWLVSLFLLLKKTHSMMLPPSCFTAGMVYIVFSDVRTSYPGGQKHYSMLTANR